MERPRELPAELLPIWEPLRNEVGWLHARWNIYRQLFGQSEERVELLNECSAAFFRVLQDVLIDDIQLTLAKLAEGAQARNRSNLTLEALYTKVAAITRHRPFVREVKSTLKRYKDSCSPMIHQRDKLIAHYDLSAMLNTPATPLPGVTRAQIEAALSLLSAFMNVIQTHFENVETAYGAIVMVSDADAVVELMKRGLRYEELVRDGKLRWDDLDQFRHRSA